MRSKHVGGYSRGEVAPKLFFVCASKVVLKHNLVRSDDAKDLLILDIDHSLCMRIPKVALVRRAMVNL